MEIYLGLTHSFLGNVMRIIITNSFEKKKNLDFFIMTNLKDN